jgi:hypothetical protein
LEPSGAEFPDGGFALPVLIGFVAAFYARRVPQRRLVAFVSVFICTASLVNIITALRRGAMESVRRVSLNRGGTSQDLRPGEEQPVDLNCSSTARSP